MKKTPIITASIIVMGLNLGAIVLPVSAAPVNNVSYQPLMLAAAQSHHGEGTVTTIDKPGKRIEFKHGPIKSLGWMGMKMFFNVDDMDLLEDVKVGDKVDFEFIKTKDGRFVITDIEKQG